MKEKIQKRVSAGIEYLNNLFSGTEWVHQINLDNLEMDSPSRCILGQLRPSELGINISGLEDKGNFFAKVYKMDLSKDSGKYGLTDFRGEINSLKESISYYKELTLEWKHQLSSLQEKHATT